MLKGIKLILSEPICNCEKDNIGWGIHEDAFFIICNTCQTRLLVPKVKANIIFDKPYPKGRIEKENILTLLKDVK